MRQRRAESNPSRERCMLAANKKTPSALTRANDAYATFAVPPCFVATLQSRPLRAPSRPDSVSGVPVASYPARAQAHLAHCRSFRGSFSAPHTSARTTRRFSGEEAPPTILVHRSRPVCNCEASVPRVYTRRKGGCDDSRSSNLCAHSRHRRTCKGSVDKLTTPREAPGWRRPCA